MNLDKGVFWEITVSVSSHITDWVSYSMYMGVARQQDLRRLTVINDVKF